MDHLVDPETGKILGNRLGGHAWGGSRELQDNRAGLYEVRAPENRDRSLTHGVQVR